LLTSRKKRFIPKVLFKEFPDPIDDRKFQEWKESGKSQILLGITLNPRKCIGEKVRRIPTNVKTKCKRERVHEDEGNKFLDPEIP